MSSAALRARVSSSIIRPSTSRYLSRPQGARLINSFGTPVNVTPLTETSHLPFDFTNKRAFTYKFIAYLGFGFALPWVAIGWIWYRPGGLKNP
ncbi:hypothetical protein BT96DRAFT_994504 [Gymnopus androsaceus JB14]|uniref:Cytochrome c oxidase subunit 8, mitochondrial n=1 Tax=Gymnopus androsaceus JB14 TaxID=1447944 RepID=A0A6A4HM45_9AGAR|nr:hypothetical protein BT96DRAFT_994504 [Gymnopus androsaceus JB14]